MYDRFQLMKDIPGAIDIEIRGLLTILAFLVHFLTVH
jgi:hypothetical protein